MILDHCHRASCAQIIEALRAKVEELSKDRDYWKEQTHDWYIRDVLQVEEQLHAANAKIESLKAMLAEQWAQPELKAALAENARLREALEKLASVEGNGDQVKRILAQPQDRSALDELLKAEREKNRVDTNWPTINMDISEKVK